VGKVKFSEQVTPDARLVSYEIDIKKVMDRSLALGIADGVMKVDGVEAYRAEGLKVALFAAYGTASLK